MERILIDALVKFKLSLSEDRLRVFRSTTVQTLQACVITIQRDQEKAKGMMDFTRIARFIQAFEQFENVVRPCLGQDPELSDLSSCIWGPTKSIIESAKENATAFDLILETYDKLGGTLPLVAEHQSILQQQPQWGICLAWIYEDLLQFNSDLLSLFKVRDWAKTFVVNRKDYDTKFEALLGLFDNHKTILETAVSIQHNGAGPQITQILCDLATRQQRRFEEQQEFAVQQQQISSHIQQQVDDLVVRNQGNYEELRSEIIQSYHQMRELLTSQSESREERRRQKQYREVVNWLRSPGDQKPEVQYHEDYQKITSAHPKTGRWFLENEQVKNWMEEDIPDFSGLWVNGKKGAGKTILASRIIDHLTEFNKESKTSYFYCRQDNRQIAEPRVLSIMKSLLTQMLAHDWDILPTMYDKSLRGGHELKDEQTAIGLLNLFAEIDKNRFIVIDGLDELEKADTRRIVEILKAMVQRCDDNNKPGRIRVMLLSTDCDSIENDIESNDRFKKFPIRLNYSAEDIGLFVSKRIDELSRKFELDDGDTTRAKEKICKNSMGVFLYASLVIENLFGQSDRYSVKKELWEKEFPDTYKKVYERILERLRTTLSQNMWSRSKEILGWLAYANRPLKLYELKAALAIRVTDEGVVHPQDKDFKLRHDIRQMCGPLVHIIGETRVEFSHQLAREFVMESEKINTQAVECDLAFRCLNYLSTVYFYKDLQDGIRESNAKKGFYAFQDYAASQWPAHLKTVIQNSASIFDTQVKYITNATIALRAFCLARKPEPIKFGGEQKDLEAEIKENARRDCEAFEKFDFYQYLLQIWTHILGHSELPPKERNLISIKDLKEVLKKNRELISKLSLDLDEGSDLSKELKEHYGTNLFKCDRIDCAYFYEGFETQEALKSHSNRHERPFQCPVTTCSFAQFGFSSNKDRDKHTRNYHPELSDHPGGFIQLNRRIVENAKHSCDDCGRSFTRKANLDDHINGSHRGLRPYACSTCGKAFTRNNDRRRHEKLHVRRQR